MRWTSQKTTGSAMTTPMIKSKPGSDRVSETDALKLVTVLVGTVNKLVACAELISAPRPAATEAPTTAIFLNI